MALDNLSEATLMLKYYIKSVYSIFKIDVLISELNTNDTSGFCFCLVLILLKDLININMIDMEVSYEIDNCSLPSPFI